MIHAIKLTDTRTGARWNTRDDWGLALQTQPIFAMPPVKTRILESPAMDGVIDVTTAVAGYPMLGNREGTFQFAAKAQQQAWQTLISEIARAMHGQTLRAELEDDPGWYYEGSFALNIGECSPRHAIVAIDYSVGPYAWADTVTVWPWRWDPFSFVDGVIGWGVYTDAATGITYTGADAFGHITVTTEPLALEFRATYPTQGLWPLGAAGSAPVTPNFTATGAKITLTITTTDGYVMEIPIAAGSQTAGAANLVLYRDGWLYKGRPATVTAVSTGSATLGLIFRPGKL